MTARAFGSFLALALVIPMIACGPATVQAAGHSSMAAGLNAQTSHWTQIASPQERSLRTRRAAGFLALIPGGLIFVLYLYRRRPYLIAWAAAWILLALMLYLIPVGADSIRDGEARLGGVVVGVGRGLGLASAALLCVGIRSFRGDRGVPRPLLVIAIAAAIWLLASTEIIGLSRTLITIYVALSLLYVVASGMYLQAARVVRMTGPLVIGVGAAGLGSTYAYVASLAGRGLTSVEAPNITVFVSIAWHALVAFGMHLMVFEDMGAELQTTHSDLAQTQRDLQAAAVTDPLTGSYNRRFFDEVIGRELERHRRHRLPLSLVFIDCDNLKGVNDTLGHVTGDEVLRLMADVIRRHVRQTDYVFRWGGDEFVVMLSCDEAQARAKAAEVQKAFMSEPLTRRLPEGTGLSVGSVAVPPDTHDLLPLIRQADERMYGNKRRLT